MEFSAAVFHRASLARNGKLLFIRRTDDAYLRELKCAHCAETLSAEPGANGLTVAAWRTAGHFAAVKQDGISFHTRGINLQALARGGDIRRRILIRSPAGLARYFTQIAERFTNQL